MNPKYTFIFLTAIIFSLQVEAGWKDALKNVAGDVAKQALGVTNATVDAQSETGTPAALQESAKSLLSTEQKIKNTVPEYLKWSMDELREKAESTGDPLLQGYLGKALSRLGNKEEGEKWSRLSAAKNHPFGLYGLEEYSKAYDGMLVLAESGDPEAQANLGAMYELALGTEKDIEKAFKWNERAALQGYTRAQCNLGLCYQYGKGVEKDSQKAVGWYEQAALQGDVSAQCNLGLCYEQGVGVEENRQKAVEWYEQAALQGDARGQYLLGWACSDVQWLGNLQKAVELLEKSIAQGYKPAMERAAFLYARGSQSGYTLTLERDPEKSKELYAIAFADFIKQKEADSKNAPDGTFVMKSMYIGMPFTDAYDLLRYKSGTEFSSKKLDSVDKEKGGKYFAGQPLGLAFNMADAAKVLSDYNHPQGAPQIIGDENGEVTAFLLCSEVVDSLFNTADLSGEEFAKMFCDAYDIPSMEFKSREQSIQELQIEMEVMNMGGSSFSRGAWRYRHPSGVLIQISDKKALSITKIPKTKERSFD